MNEGRWLDIALLAGCLVLLAAVLHAGSRPYDFFLRNDVSWIEGAPGLRFDGQGIAATSGDLAFLASGGPTSISVEVWLRRGASVPADGGVVLALGDGEAVAPLQLAQWKESLYFRFPAIQDGGLVEQTLSLGERFPEGETRFVAFVSGAGGGRAYVQGAAVKSSARSLPLAAEGGSLRGRLVLGSRIQACRGWVGDVDGIALYGRALSSHEIADHAARARQGGVRALSGETGLLALYSFEEGSGERGHDVVGGAGDLVIPERYRPLDPGFLQLDPAVAGRQVSVADAVANLAGFVPVGLLLAWTLRRWTALRRLSIFWFATGLGFGLSLTIETIQTVLPSRVSSAADLALNSAGSALGALLALATLRIQRGRGRRAGLARGSRNA